MKKCYTCNLQFDDKLQFCPYCGKPLAYDREYLAEQKRKEEEARKKEEARIALYEKKEKINQRFRSIFSRINKKVNLELLDFKKYERYGSCNFESVVRDCNSDKFDELNADLDKLEKTVDLLNNKFSYYEVKDDLNSKANELRRLTKEVLSLDDRIVKTIGYELLRKRFDFQYKYFEETRFLILDTANRILPYIDGGEYKKVISTRKDHTYKNVGKEYKSGKGYAGAYYTHYKTYEVTKITYLYANFKYGFQSNVRDALSGDEAGLNALKYYADLRKFVKFMDLAKSFYEKVLNQARNYEFSKIKISFDDCYTVKFEEKREDKIGAFIEDYYTL